MQYGLTGVDETPPDISLMHHPTLANSDLR